MTPSQPTASDFSSGLEKNCRILVVDDNGAIHDDFRKILATDNSDAEFDAEEASFFGETPNTFKRTQFELDFAFQGQEALQRVQASLEANRRYSVVFTDVRMPPGWDGVETTVKLWEADPDLQVVICTAHADYSWEEMMTKIGNCERVLILKKPFDTIEVLQLAHALTEKWALLQTAKQNTETLEVLVKKRTQELEIANALLGREIDENKAANERVREQATLIQEARDAIIVTGWDGTIRFWNRGAESLYGWTAGEALSQKAEDLLYATDRTREQRNAGKQALAEKGSWNSELEQITKDGRSIIVESRWAIIRDEDGQAKSVLGINTDITEKKQIEAQLRQAQKLESIGQLAAGIAHEINTPTQYIGDNVRFVQDSLTAVYSLLKAQEKVVAEAREKGLLPELISEVDAAAGAADFNYLARETPKAIADSLVGVDRVSKIVKAMKDFCHPGSEQKTLTDLNKCIEATVCIARNEWKFVAEIVMNLDPELPEVPCLPGQFNQVILNLIINAAHAIRDVVGNDTGTKGAITISTQQCDGWAEIRVQDTGAGIPESIRDKIFDPFFTTKPVGQGTGQGLMIARSVVIDKHQGEISFDTEPGRGTTFLIRLPLDPSK